MKKQVFLIEPEDHDTMNEVVEAMVDTKVKLQVTIEKYWKKRSDSENSYYWLVMTWLGDYTGNTKESMHEHFKFLFLQIKKGKFTRVLSTSELNTLQFEKYLDRIRQWAWDELAFRVKLPNEVDPSEYESLYKL